MRLLMGDTLDGVNDLEFVYLAGVGESKKTKTDVRPIWDRGEKRGFLEFSRVLRILPVLFVLFRVYTLGEPSYIPFFGRMPLWRVYDAYTHE